MEIFMDFTFEAAHRLTQLPAGHPCANIHGHSFIMRVAIDGEVDVENGWVMDFADIQKAVEPVRRMIDHQYLNEIEGLSNPTSENLAIWFWEKLIADLAGLSRIIVQENYNSGCVYEGPKGHRHD